MIHLVHGIRQFKPGDHMRPLARALRSRCKGVGFVNYGPVWIPITNQRATNAVLESVKPGDDVVAYSNGAWAAHQALETGCRIRHLFLISPALNVNAEFPNCESVTVFTSEGDDAVLLARWYRKLIGLLPWRWANPHGWGAMGRLGYQGSDPKVRNIHMGPNIGHSWYGYPGVVNVIAEKITSVV